MDVIFHFSIGVFCIPASFVGVCCKTVAPCPVQFMDKWLPVVRMPHENKLPGLTGKLDSLVTNGS